MQYVTLKEMPAVLVFKDETYLFMMVSSSILTDVKQNSL